tara:strand:+ start:140 stop:631 length:492 start_codon:yes stop_codon:yes gene_type:complete
MSKVNLIYGVGDVLHTHININPFAEDADGERIIRDDITNLDKHVDDAELQELVALDVIDYIPITKIDSVLENWSRKIRVGGKIIIGGIDLMECCKSLSDYSIDIVTANSLIHGEQTKPYLVKRLNFTAVALAEYLEEAFNFTIIKKRLNNYRMIVEAKRETWK